MKSKDKSIKTIRKKSNIKTKYKWMKLKKQIT